MKRLCSATACALVLATSLVLFVPWSPARMNDGLDPSFRFALNVLYESGASFGREVIYQYGPLGFLALEEYYSGTYVQLMVIRILLAALLGALVWAFVRSLVPSTIGQFLWSLLFLGCASWFDARFFLYAHLFFQLSRFGSRRAIRFVALFAPPTLAVVSLIKFNYLLVSIGVLVLAAGGAVDAAWRNREDSSGSRKAFVASLLRQPAVAAGLVYPVCLVIAWLLAGQPLLHLADYLSHGFHLTRTYGSAHGFASPHRWHVPAFAALAFAFWLTVSAVEVRAQRVRGAIVSVALALLLFLAFKHGFTRHDTPHAGYAISYLLCGFWLFGLPLMYGALSPQPPFARVFPRRAVAALAVIAVAFGDSVLADGQYPPSLGHYAARVVGQVPSKLKGVVRFVRDPFWFAPYHERAAAALRQRYTLPPMSGTVDLYPANLNVLFAHGFEYQPRPLLQSFQTADPELAALNARAVVWPDGPDYILFKVETIDWRLPALEDGLAWPHLLSGYRLRDVASGYLVLEESPVARRVSLGEPEQHRVKVNEAWSLPIDKRQEHGIWAEIDLAPGLWGRMTTFVLREPLVWVEFELADGSVRGFRLVPGMAKAGFLLSPLIETTDDFARHYAPHRAEVSAGKAVVRMRLIAKKAWAFEGMATVRLRSFELGP